MKCRKDSFPNITETEYEFYILSNYKCIDNQDIKINGLAFSSNYQYIEIKASYCPTCEIEIRDLINRQNQFI